LFKPATEECVATNHEPARSQLDQLCKDYIEVTVGAGIQYMELQPEPTSRAPRRQSIRVYLAVEFMSEMGGQNRRSDPH
jgi:hypothetical protein